MQNYENNLKILAIVKRKIRTHNNFKEKSINLEQTLQGMMKISLITYLLWGIAIVGFSQDLEPAQKKNKWGYVKKENPQKFVIKAKFEEAYPFGKWLDSSFAFVRNGSYGIIDRKGKWVIKPNYDTIFTQKKLGEVLLFAKKSNESFLLNRKGEIVSEGFGSVEPLNKEVFLAVKNNQMGILLRKNDVYETILPIEFDYVSVVNFKNTLFQVKKNGKIRFYDLTTKKFSEEYDKHQSIRIRDTATYETFIVVEKNAKKGLIDEKMNFIVNIEYDNIRHFKEKRKSTIFELTKAGKKGLIDETGKTILPIEFDGFLYDQNASYITALKNNLFGLYDTTGKQILNHLYEDIRFWKEQNVFQVSKDKLQGLVSTEEKIVLPILYKNLMRVSYQTPCYILATKEKGKNILALENNTVQQISQEDFEELIAIEPPQLKFIGKMKGKENVYLLDEKKLKKTLKNDYDEITTFNKTFYKVRSKGKQYFLDKKTEKLTALPPHTLLLNEDALYMTEDRKFKKYTEGQPEGTFYLEQDEKAFFWNINTQQLTPTERIIPFSSDNQMLKSQNQPLQNRERNTQKTRKK